MNVFIDVYSYNIKMTKEELAELGLVHGDNSIEPTDDRFKELIEMFACELLVTVSGDENEDV